MDPHVDDIDDAVDNRLPVNDDEYQEAVGGQPADGFDVDGMPQTITASRTCYRRHNSLPLYP